MFNVNFQTFWPSVWYHIEIFHTNFSIPIQIIFNLAVVIGLKIFAEHHLHPPCLAVVVIVRAEALQKLRESHERGKPTAIFSKRRKIDPL